MKKRIHLSQSIEGALRHWKHSDWRALARDNGCTVDEAKDYLWRAFKEGKRFLPLSEECVGFDDQRGCPGHPEE